MPSHRQGSSPITIAITPGISSYTTTTISPSSPKAVRFAPKSSGLVTGVSRPLSPTEAWSLYHFESHARTCRACYSPYEVHQRGGRLCDVGHGLAQDAAIHVYHLNGEVYSTTKEQHKHVRVEIPHDYDQVRGLLKSMDYGVRSRAPPVVSHDRSYYVASRLAKDMPSQQEAIIQVAKSKGHRSKHKSTRYRTIIAEEDVDDFAVWASRDDERRGSLYRKDVKAQDREGYRLEIREPERRERRERRRTDFWS